MADEYRVTILGHCALTAEELVSAFLTRGNAVFQDLPGEYVIVLERPNECHIVSSPLGIRQYFYALHEGVLWHAESLMSILAQSHLPWKWNWTALADLIQLDHLVEDETLHRSIYRVSAGTIVRFIHGSLTISALPHRDIYARSPSSPAAALESFNDAVSRRAAANVVVSMSAGFDSRVILSSLLRLGLRPHLVAMGFPDSTDVVVSRQIASALDLELSTIELCLEEYLRHGQKISALTNGSKTAHNWHTYLYTRSAALDRESLFFVGANGEFARSYYLDKGVLSVAADRVPVVPLRYFWGRKLKCIFSHHELEAMRPDLRELLGTDAIEDRANRMATLCGSQLMPGLDRFYLEQRVRHFISNGLILYDANANWQAPFLDTAWINASWNLPRRWKLGSNWHRYALYTNYPALTKFPEQGTRDFIARHAPPLYWNPRRAKTPTIPYARYDEWFASSTISQFLDDNASVIGDLVDAGVARDIISDHQKELNRTRAIAVLLSLTFWGMNIAPYR